MIGAALAKLGPAGDVSHEEALGGQAIRENAAEFLRTGDRTLMRNLQATRENYWMVDDDFQLPVVAGRYFADRSVPDARKRSFVTRWDVALRKNLAFVWRQATPYADQPVATNLVSFKRDADGWWHPGSWRDSRVGYAGGRFAFDVNVVWVPAALRAIGTIDTTEPAMTTSHRVVNWPCRVDRPSGRVISSGERITTSGHRKLFHEFMNAKTATVARPAIIVTSFSSSPSVKRLNT